MAQNGKGKRRLCLDLSRCVNKLAKAPNFRIESTQAALQIVEKGEYLFLFNLKSAYLQIRVNRNFVKFFKLAVEEEDGRKR